MSDKPIELDAHRGMAAQKATDLRRLLADAETSATSLRSQLRETEAKLIAAPAASWPEAAAKARYVLKLYASLLHPEDSRHRDLVAAVLSDFARLSGEPEEHHS